MAAEGGDDKVRLTNEAEQQQKDALIQPVVDDAAKAADKVPEGRVTGALLFAVFAATVGGSFQFGYHIGCVNAPGALIKSWFNESNYHLNGVFLSPEKAETYWALTVSIFAAGGMIGGLLSGWFADKLGRKQALLINNFIAIIGIVLMAGAKYAGRYYLVGAGRFVIGLNSGLNSGLVPMYVTEIAPTNLRGAIGSVCQLLVTISILVSQVVGLPYIFGTEERWPLIFALAFLPAIILLVCLPLCPESPKFTLIVKNNKDQAEKDLIKLRDSNEVSAELELIEEEAKASRSQDKVDLAAMFGPALRWPLFIAIMMMLAQQFSGINATMFYSTEIFKQAGLKGTEPFYATIAMGAINVIQTLVSVWLVEHPKFGRRSLMLVGMVGMLVSCFLIVGSLTFANVLHYGWASYASIICVLLFVVAFATGPGSIPWFYVSEIFPSNARGNANSLACMANWSANFLVGLMFPTLNVLLKHYTFLVFAGLLAVFIVFTYLFVPETKNKSVEEINRDMYKNRSPTNGAAAAAVNA